MKVVIIGTNHAGIAAANAVLDHSSGNEVVMLDRNSNMSYLGCGTALWVGRQIEDYHELFYARPEDFEKKGAKVLTETTVDAIDFEKKEIHALDKKGTAFSETYDKLVLATGSRPIIPNIPGKDLTGIHFLKLFQEGQEVDHELEKSEVKRIAVIGAGYIGTEIAEAAKRRGKEVLLFDAEASSLANYYDPDFAKEMDENLAAHGVELHFGELATAFKGDSKGRVAEIVTDKDSYKVDLVVNCIGFTAQSELGRDHLKTFPNGAYEVDRHQQTSDPDVYAVGDVATIYSNALQDFTYIALASNAVRSGIVAGLNLAGIPQESIGVQGSNGISIWGYNMTSTGYSVKSAQKFGLDVAYTDFEGNQKAWFVKDHETVKIRIVYEKSSRRIVGAQLASKSEIIAGNVNMFSLAIQEKLTIDKFALLDLFFLPHFNEPYNYMTMAALSAE